MQACGDAHLSNFGVFGSAERRLVFDVNDFDETLPGPWEWDVKRLAASLEVAARGNGFPGKQRRKIVAAAVAPATGRRCASFAGMTNLDVWYAHADIDQLRAQFDAPAGGAGSASAWTRAWPRRGPGTACRKLAKLTRDGGRPAADHRPTRRCSCRSRICYPIRRDAGAPSSRSYRA